MHKGVANGLINETSPYLLQHAYNPVQWFPWGPEALQKAKEKDLPILVSIGYSACHWCHVMEKESFEDDAVAAFMNEHFINIKIDREERPDLDHLYMDAVQAISGSGGWPLNVFLTPDKKPFYGGTYFPPQKAFNRSSWMDVLGAMNDVFQEKRDEVEKQAENLVQHLRQSNGFVSSKSITIPEGQNFFSEDNCQAMAENILAMADKQEGGFGKAPKFLQTPAINYLLAYSSLAGDQDALGQAVLTLSKMLQGGIYDQLGGGISRYSTDDEWLVPHFEKMLYDNALFVSTLSDAYQLTGDEIFKDGIDSTLWYVLQEMKAEEGGFYTALDADSEGEEGKFYVWDKSEVAELLGNEAPVFCSYYNISEEGNWEGTNILNIKEDKTEVALQYGITIAELEEALARGKAKLLHQRATRERPGTDDKILLSSNALLITAFCKAFAATGQLNYKEEAEKLFSFLESRLKQQGDFNLYHHNYKKGEAANPAFLDDYAYLLEALIALQEISANQSYLLKAAELMESVIGRFEVAESPFFYYSGVDQQDIIIRKVEVYDGATPSANAVMAKNLVYLGIVFDNDTWVCRGRAMLYNLDEAIKKYPTSFGIWAGNYLSHAYGLNEITITGSEILPTLTELLRIYLPNKILQASNADNYEDFPLLKNKLNFGEPKIYLCREKVCLAPFSSVEDLANNLKKLSTNQNRSQ